MNMLEYKRVLPLLLSVLITSGWLKQQRLRKLHKAVYIFIITFPANFHITQSGLSLINTEIVCGKLVKL